MAKIKEPDRCLLDLTQVSNGGEHFGKTQRAIGFKEISVSPKKGLFRTEILGVRH